MQIPKQTPALAHHLTHPSSLLGASSSTSPLLSTSPSASSSPPDPAKLHSSVLAAITAMSDSLLVSSSSSTTTTSSSPTPSPQADELDSFIRMYGDWKARNALMTSLRTGAPLPPSRQQQQRRTDPAASATTLLAGVRRAQRELGGGVAGYFGLGEGQLLTAKDALPATEDEGLGEDEAEVAGAAREGK